VESGRVHDLSFLSLERYAKGLDTRGSSLMALLEDPYTEIARPFACVDDAIFRHVGPTLRRLRGATGRSLSDVAAAAGLYYQNLWRWEAGYGIPSLTLLGRLATVIGKPASAVIAEIENAAFPESKIEIKTN
jgi:hypothetical protein